MSWILTLSPGAKVRVVESEKERGASVAEARIAVLGRTRGLHDEKKTLGLATADGHGRFQEVIRQLAPERSDIATFFDRLDLDDAMLTRIATATGGRYLHISTADQLIGELDRKERRRHVSLEQPVYFPRLFWVLFVGVLATEWVLRRRFQMR